MVITSSSEQAIDYLHQAQALLVDGEVTKGITLLHRAVTVDSNFFMGHFQLALTSYLFGDEEAFQSYSEQAFQDHSSSSQGEHLLNSILHQIYTNPDSDVTQMSAELVTLYPQDASAYYLHATFQRVNSDYSGALETYQNLLAIVDNPGPVYHFIGYTEMALQHWDAARNAFEQYIQSEPDHPNPYDCMGDYYMAQKNYTGAYNYYMKAHQLDEAWGYDKAMEAKTMSEKKTAVSPSIGDTSK